MATKQTYLERLTEQTMRPVKAALAIMKRDLAETMHVPDAPWKILNKPYEELSDGEIDVLMDIYHEPDEQEPCPMCKWIATKEISMINKGAEANLPMRPMMEEQKL